MQQIKKSRHSDKQPSPLSQKRMADPIPVDPPAQRFRTEQINNAGRKRVADSPPFLPQHCKRCRTGENFSEQEAEVVLCGELKFSTEYPKAQLDPDVLLSYYQCYSEDQNILDELMGVAEFASDISFLSPF